jgi:hypothetical protein
MHIEELKFWVNKNYFLNKNLLSYLKQKILYMEIILNIFNKKYTLSLKMLRKIRSAKKKIKLLLFLIIPNSIFKKIKINFS